MTTEPQKCTNCGVTPMVPNVEDGTCSACGVDPFLVEIVGERQALAAVLQTHADDKKKLVVELAKMLQSGFAENTEIKEAGIFTKHIQEIAVTAKHHIYRLTVQKHHALLLQRSRNVRGIKLKEETLALADWLKDLSQALSEIAAESQTGRAALTEFLRS